MSVEVKTSGDHPASMAERVSKRLRNSGAGANPNVTVQKGEGPTRTHTNIHSAGHYVDPATRARESDPQTQRFHDEATTQTTKAYFRGHGKHEEEEQDD
jgi:hypothetical protein